MGVLPRFIGSFPVHMTSSAFPQGDPGEEARNRVIQALSAHFAEDRLSLEEFERRVTLAYAVRTSGDLDALLADLPRSALPAATAPPKGVAVPQSDAPRSRFVMAFMSGVERRGRWVAPRELNVVAFMGGVDIDLREAIIPPEGMHIHAVAFMGGVEIRVPPGVRLDSDGFAFMGGFEDRQELQPSADPDAPLIKINGFAMMGAVEVQVKAPGDSLPAPEDE